MKTITVRDFESLLQNPQPPCVSVYLTTDSHLPGGPRDRIRLKNLLRDAEQLLEERYGRSDAAALIEPLADTFDRPQHRSAGLALLSSPGQAVRYALPVPVPELAIVSSTFHTKPLLSYLVRERHFFILALSERAAKLYEATPSSAAELPALQRSFGEGLDSPREVEPYRGVHGGDARGRASHRRGVHEDTRTSKDRLARHFKALDEEIHAYLSDRAAPLVLAGVAQHHALYRSVSRYRRVLDVGIEGNVDHLGIDELRRRAWAIVAEHEAHTEARTVAQYVAAVSVGKTSDELADVAKAVVQGRVRVLLHAEGAHVWGFIDPRSGDCHVYGGRPSERRGRAEIIDDLCELTLLRGGDVVEVSPVRMPSLSPVAAIYRY